LELSDAHTHTRTHIHTHAHTYTHAHRGGCCGEEQGEMGALVAEAGDDVIRLFCSNSRFAPKLESTKHGLLVNLS